MISTARLRARTRKAASAVVAAAALTALLAGCGAAGGSSTDGVLPPPAAVPTPSSAPSDAPDAAGGGRCRTADLQARLVVRPDELGAHRVAVLWSNRSSGPCTMFGFGGADLDGPDQQPFGPTYHLPRSDEQPSTVRLDPGGTAQTVLNYLSPDGTGEQWLPDHALVTPPDETHSVSLPWSFGPVLRQDAATHPGTFLHPVTEVPATSAPPCTARDVAADLVAGDAAAGNRYATLQLSARNAVRCELAGPLPIVLQDAGDVIVHRERDATTASTITVDADHPASVRLHWTVANTPQVTPGAVSVRLPGTADAVTVPWRGGPVDDTDQHRSITAGPVTSSG